MKTKIKALLGQLNHGLVEREETLKTALLAVLAGENMVLIGPPGTGKSMIARRIAGILEPADGSNRHNYFEYLLTKFSTPEEIFGPLSITELKADRFKRNTAGYLPTVDIAFLDEIFKASSSILNALLTILNERIYHNGAEAQRVPMRALIAASNELPADQEELAALYDRFMMRRFVDYVSQENQSRLFEKPSAKPPVRKLNADDLHSIKQAAQAVTLPQEIVEVIQRIWVQHKETFKEDARERLSDRRLKKVIEIMSVSAATNGRSEVDLSDVFLLKDCLWNHPENAGKVRDLIMKTLRSRSRQVPEDGEYIEMPAPIEQPRNSSVTVRGFEGSGTASDPLLIKDYHHLMSLERADVGQRGYYFRQTADIDCTPLTSWMNISFQGHYDGNGHTITHRQDGSKHSALFLTIQAQSSVNNLKLVELALADEVAGSHIASCSTSTDLIRKNANATSFLGCESRGSIVVGLSKGCTIGRCESIGSLIAGSAVDCAISSCEARSFLIRGSAENCSIADCLVRLEVKWSTTVNHQMLGGIAASLSAGCIVERCYVSGKIQNSLSGDVYVYGIARDCKASLIRQCAVGKIALDGSCVRLVRRIAGENDRLEHNVSIDTNNGTDGINGMDGRTVSAALFKQHYFEYTLDWDFENVWDWDPTEDRPCLRSSGTSSTSAPSELDAQGVRMTDLLTKQMRENIWI